MGGSRSWWSPPRSELGSKRTLVLLAVATFFSGYATFLLPLALPLIRRSFHLSLSQGGIVLTIVFTGALAGFVLLALADRWGRRPVLTLSIAGSAVFTLATAFTHGVVEFTALQFVTRAFSGAQFALATIVLVETTAQQRRGRALGILTSMTAFGTAAAGAGYLVVDAVDASWRILFVIGAVPLLLVPAILRGLPETAPPKGTAFIPVSALPRRLLAALTALVFLFTVFPAAVATLASSLMKDAWHLQLSELRPYYFVFWALGGTGFFVSGRLMDRWGRRPTAIIFLLCAAVAGFVAFVPTAMLLRAIGLAFVIFGLTGATPCIAAFSTELFAVGARGRANAWLRGVDMAGMACAPAVATALTGPLGGLGPALAAVGSTYVLAAVVVVRWIPEPRGHEESAEARTTEEQQPYHLV
jgi:MFS family permease